MNRTAELIDVRAPGAPQDPRATAPQEQLAPVAAIRGRFAKATSVMVVLTLFASITNYASNLIFSRLLSPASYGDLTALTAFTVIAAVPTGAAQTVVAERIAVLRAQGEQASVRYLIRHACAHIAAIAVVLGLIYSACIPLVKLALGLQAIGPAIALAPLLVLAFFIPLAYGVLQGMERFVALGMLMFASAFSRIGFGVPWTVLGGGGAGGPLLGQALGNLLALAATAWLIREYMLRRGTGAATSGLRRRPDRRALTASGAFIAFALISNLDVVMAKILLSAHAAGEYAALVTVEKIVIFLPGAVAVVMVPAAAKARLAEGSAASVLRVAALLVAITTMVVAIPAAIAPHLVLETMFGQKYVAAASGVLPIACAGAGLALLYLLVVYTVAIQDRRWVWLIAAGVVLQVSAISLLHSSAVEIAIVQASVIAIVLVANEFVFHPVMRAERLVLRFSRRRTEYGHPR
jgi:O-antigen/teichoic acid export membrane protein